MPETRFVADALGVVTIILVSILILLGLLCIIYSIYFHVQIRSHSLIQLGYFSGPWVIRILFIIFAIWWSLGEVVRLNLTRRKGRALSDLSVQWQENICKGYVISNLGFAEPCLFLTLVFLLRASLQKTDSGTLSPNWNRKTAGYIVLYCLPVFILQLVVVLIAPNFSTNGRFMDMLPDYFTSTAVSSKYKDGGDVALCTYPLFNTILLGLFVSCLTIYLIWLGRRILNLVINKGLRTRVRCLIISVSSCFPLRILFLGLSVLSEPEHMLFEAFAILSFFSLFCCALAGIYFVVYCPIAESLALRDLEDIEARRRFIQDHNETFSLIANQGRVMEMDSSSPDTSSVTSTKQLSISFRAMERPQSSQAFVELSLFSPSRHSSPPGSPQFLGWPMLPPMHDRTQQYDQVRD